MEMKEALEAFVLRLLSKYDYYALYPARVVRQLDATTVEVIPDDPRLPRGVRSAKLQLGIPGTSVTIAQGSRCLLGFENGDPRRPVAALWEAGSSVGGVTLGGAGAARPVARVGDAVALAVPGPILVTGTINGSPYTGTMTIVTPISGVIASGSGKVQAAT